MANNEELKKEVLDIAEYLGCNGGELWSEISKLFSAHTEESNRLARLDEQNHILHSIAYLIVYSKPHSKNGLRLAIEAVQDRIATLSKGKE